jgi:hypothetical protein
MAEANKDIWRTHPDETQPLHEEVHTDLAQGTTAAEEFFGEPEMKKLKEFETWLRIVDDEIKQAFLEKILKAMADDEPDMIQNRQQTQAEAGARILLLDSVPDTPPPIGDQAIIDIKPEDHWNNVPGARIHEIEEPETEARGEQ